LIELLMKQINY